jgi:hypothetical protein
VAAVRRTGTAVKGRPFDVVGRGFSCGVVDSEARVWAVRQE